MKLEQQVCSLELAKRLKELGVPQKSLFYWAYEEPYKIITSEYLAERAFYFGDNPVSAFTVAELGDMLWHAFEKIGWDVIYQAYGEVFGFKGTQRIGELGIVNLMRRPDMGAKMLIYLLENKLITL